MWACAMHICMPWRSIAFDWNHARAFLVSAETGSFSAAAREIGLTQPTLGRQVAALEEELGVTLFERVGKRLELTTSGLELVEHVRAMGEAASRVSLGAAGQSSAIDGIVRIAASQAVSAFLLPPIVGRLRRDYPGIEVELVVSNATSDLRRREADVAVRHFRPNDADLVAQRVKDEGAAWMYATPAYIRQLGNPKTPRQLAKHAAIFGFDETPRLRSLLNDWGLPVEARNFPVRTDDHLVQWELARRGMGICIMMEEVGDAEPLVKRLLPSYPPPVTLPTWITSHREVRTSRRIRVVFDRLVAALTRGEVKAKGVGIGRGDLGPSPK